MDNNTLSDIIKSESRFIAQIYQQMSKTVVGQKTMIERVLIALLSGGHILIEGLPGLAKTLTINTLAKIISAQFKRIQFTPDLLPSDLTGAMIYNTQTGQFTVKKGPIFANLVLADEINRAPAKVQSALLEAMAEKTVTIGETTHTLPDPFVVMATQNPIEQEGTFPLPEAQLDRFLLKIQVHYPTYEEERLLIQMQSKPELPVTQDLISIQQIIKARELIKQIFIDPKITDYVLKIVFATRDPAAFGLKKLSPYIAVGASPRATLALIKCSRVYAFMNGRSFVIPEDIKNIVPDILRHRIITTYEADAERVSTLDILNQIISHVEKS